jgi:excisionase family DNA binding protein
MKTVPITSRGQLDELTSTIEQLLEDGKQLSVTVAENDELLSPNQAAARLGFSRQHVRRLVDAGGLVGEQLPGSSYWKIPLSSILCFEQRREHAARRADAFSAALDELDAPAE